MDSANQSQSTSGGAGSDGLALTRFTFDHKVFAVEGAYFSLSNDKLEAVFNVPLGSTTGAVSLKALRANFGIDEDSADSRLLDVVDASLKFVKLIRPGESIPSELLDGTASWSVEDHHRRIASCRLALQLASWVSGREMVVTDLDQLEMMVEDPGTKGRIKEAYHHLAQRLGLPTERKDEVNKKIEAFAHELAYIEALRERASMVKEIADKLGKIWAIYKSDRTLSNDITRMIQLINTPISEINSIFLQVDAQSGEILSLLKTFESQVSFTRQMRNDLHVRLMDWEEMFQKWDGVTLERKPKTEALLKDTYRFLAQRFITSQVWKR